MNEYNKQEKSVPIMDIHSTSLNGQYHLQIGVFYKRLSLLFGAKYGKPQNAVRLIDAMTVTIDTINAAKLYEIVIRILNGELSEKEVIATFQSNSETILTFEYKYGEAGQLEPFLIIERKDRGKIIFRLDTQDFQVNENGQMVTKVVQAGLRAFSFALFRYLYDFSDTTPSCVYPDDFESYIDENNRLAFTIKNEKQRNNYQKYNNRYQQRNNSQGNNYRSYNNRYQQQGNYNANNQSNNQGNNQDSNQGNNNQGNNIDNSNNQDSNNNQNNQQND